MEGGHLSRFSILDLLGIFGFSMIESMAADEGNSFFCAFANSAVAFGAVRFEQLAAIDQGDGSDFIELCENDCRTTSLYLELDLVPNLYPAQHFVIGDNFRHQHGGHVAGNFLVVDGDAVAVDVDRLYDADRLIPLRFGNG